MKIVSSFKNIEHTESLDKKIEAKSHKLSKYFEGNFEMEWVCYVSDEGFHCADLKLFGPSFEYFASGRSESLYKSFDIVINKVIKQVVKKKEKWKGHMSGKHKNSFRESQIKEQVWDEEYWEEKAS